MFFSFVYGFDKYKKVGIVSLDFAPQDNSVKPHTKAGTMTSSTARHETAARKFSFALPTEGQTKIPHGMFFCNGEPVSAMYFSSTSALSALDEYIASGQIPSEYQAAIAEEIRGSGLSEKEPYIGPFHFEVVTTGPDAEGFLQNANGIFVGEPIAFFYKTEAREGLEKAIKNGAILPEERDGLLEEINNSKLPEDEQQEANRFLAEMFMAMMGRPKYDGPYTFEVSQNGDTTVGHVVDSDNQHVPGGFRSKAHAIYEIEAGAKKGMFHEDDHIRLLEQVEASPLPADWNMEVSFKPCTNCPAPIPHGYIHIDGKQTGKPQASVAQVEGFLAKIVRIGAMSEARAEEIRNDMRSAGLPESIGN